MSDYNTSSTAYRNSTDAHRGEFEAWITANGLNGDLPRALAYEMSRGKIPADLAAECERDGWFFHSAVDEDTDGFVDRPYDWFDRDTLASVVADLIEGAAACAAMGLLIEIADEMVTR